MTNQKNNHFKNTSRLKKRIVAGSMFITVFSGMIMAAIAVNKFENYYNPYLFGFTFGTIGLLVGLFVANKLKSKIVINQKMLANYSLAVMFIATGFIGLFMLLGQQINETLSTKEKCDNYYITNKIFRKKVGRTRELNILVINVDGISRKVITTHKYWQSVSMGKQINVCIYNSKIGFDYLTLTNENYAKTK